MHKVTINTRDQLTILNLDLIAAVKADGNFSRIYYLTNREVFLSLGISKVETILKQHGGKQNRFVRLGRSTLINHVYLHQIDLQRQLIILTDGGANEVRLSLSKKTLKPYKEAIVLLNKTQNTHGKENDSREAGKPAL